ncbi:MAG: phosphotransferase [Lachnospiraceae bacterium]|nr:phosphotransferase [Lachnospiraceae bacterium]
MQEKQKELFDQYDMELLHVRRGRGGLICETEDGMFDLQICNQSPRKLEQAFEIKEQLIEQKFSYVDQYYRNKDGELLTYDRYQTPYIMKRHFDGRECDIRNKKDIAAAGEQLGILHQCLKNIPAETYPRKKNRFQQKTKELIRTKQYIAKKNEKKEFEVLFNRYFDLFWKDVKTIYEEEEQESALCHGAYHHHHLLMLPGQKMAVVQFENFYVGNQLEDVFQLMRKILEKNQYDFSYAKKLLDAYETKRILRPADYRYLFCMLSYPEKYWKLANQYMNHRKSFLSPKLTEKLQDAVRLQEKKEKFLQDFWLFYLQS